MHGIIFLELGKFVKTNYDNSTWFKLLDEAGLGIKSYLSTETYPDEELMTIIDAASKTTGIAVPDLIEAFGEFIVPDLVKTYQTFIKAEWSFLDLLEHIEDTIHRTVRMQNPGAEPPRLKITRKSEREVEIDYFSERNIPTLGIGIIKGLAKHYNVQNAVSISTKKVDKSTIFNIIQR